MIISLFNILHGKTQIGCRKIGKALFMIQNVLPAVLTGYIRGFSIEDLKVSIESFIPSPAQTPGRLNMFRFKEFNLLLDYAHNPAGLRALHEMLKKMNGAPKVGLVAGIGGESSTLCCPVYERTPFSIPETACENSKPQITGLTSDRIVMMPWVY